MAALPDPVRGLTLRHPDAVQLHCGRKTIVTTPGRFPTTVGVPAWIALHTGLTRFSDVDTDTTDAPPPRGHMFGAARFVGSIEIFRPGDRRLTPGPQFRLRHGRKPGLAMSPTGDIVPVSDDDYRFARWGGGRWAWIFDTVITLRSPVKMSGGQGLFRLTDRERVVFAETADLHGYTIRGNPSYGLTDPEKPGTEETIAGREEIVDVSNR